MTRESIKAAIIEIINEIVPDEDLSDLDHQKPLRDQIDLDSMDFLDIVMELRKKYRIEVPEEDYDELSTMNSTIDYLLPKMESL
ncbi:MAG TPA: acyl carrier protein [Nitrospinota bacterium]|jgi:acyl carrier protein|nr:acyl carrier protein [Nitrospinota bacterium]|tara:strand:- start:36337 stop:36588 length:252 start_codon:yes stop_codon:yes gene_type:complete